LKNLALLLFGFLVAIVSAELTLRWLPVPGGMFAADPDPTWPARRLVPNAAVTSSFGWDLANAHHSRINNLGYASPFEYRDGAKVGMLFGDSYVEGLSNDDGQRLQSFLAPDLGLAPQGIYSFGTSGGALPHYLGVAALAAKRYRPQWAVFLVTDRDFVEGFDAEPGFYRWAAAPETIGLVPEVKRGRLAKLVRGLALSRYLRLNLKFSGTTLFSSGLESAPKPVCHRTTLSADDLRLLDGWLADARSALGLSPSRIVIVLDSDRTPLYRPGASPPRTCPDRDQLARDTLGTRARAQGFAVVDTAPLFASAWTADHVPLDRKPLDAHWSPYANKLVAAAIARALKTPATAS
jgi:hypothetical protein